MDNQLPHYTQCRRAGILLSLLLVVVAGSGCAPAGYVQWAIATGGHAKRPAAVTATPEPDSSSIPGRQ